MLCGHTFCLHPCLLPENSNQDFVECPLCRIETPLAYVEPGIAGPSPSSKTSSVCPECCRSVPLKCQFCQHCSKTICQACANLHLAEVLTPLVKKFISLQSERIALASLKATLSQLKDNKDSCKERLLSGITLAVGQLQWSADSALEKAKLVVVSTSAEDQAQMKKLQGNLKTLMQMQAALGQTADSIQRGENYTDQTGRVLGSGIHEHKLAVRRGDAHAYEMVHEFNFAGTKIGAHAGNKTDRELIEAWALD
ncbi:hypothetical protein SprV_0501878600 [Sparganum proliferum]